MEDLSSWLTIPEMAKATGKSVRSIERLITLHKVTVAKRPVEGMKPITVIAPDEVEKHRGVTLRPTVEQTAIAPSRQADRLPAKLPMRQSDTRAILKALEQLRMPVAQQMYLTKREAALYLGFEQAEIDRMIRANLIPTIRLMNGRLRIARKDLEHYTPPIRQVTEWRNGQHEATS